MANENILHIPRSDSAGDYVLVNVSRPGTSSLNLKLIGTEGEAPYVGSLKTSQINKLRAKNYRGGDDEWSGILSYVFNQDQDAATSRDWVQGLEVVAMIKSEDEEDDGNKELVITLRKRIDSITQRLGTVTLKQDDDQAIQLFDWTAVAASRANNLGDEISTLKAKYQEAETTIKQLHSQLEELLQAKDEHDDQLIGKFVQLLNEKKLKIRNQQRILSTAKLDPEKAAALETAVDEEQPRKPDSSRRSKRKAQDEAQESESDDGFDTMDVDKKDNSKNNNEEVENEGAATESEGQSTPQPLEDETASELEEDEDETAANVKATVEAGDDSPPPAKKRAPAAAAPSRRGNNTRSASAKEPSSPPPRRELPFLRRSAAPKSKPVEKRAQNDDNETTGSEDDEL